MISPLSDTPAVPAVMAVSIVRSCAELIGTREGAIWSRAGMMHHYAMNWGSRLTPNEMQRLYDQVHLLVPERPLILVEAGYHLAHTGGGAALASLRMVSRSFSELLRRAERAQSVFSKVLMLELLEQNVQDMKIRVGLRGLSTKDPNMLVFGIILGFGTRYSDRAVEIEWYATPLERETWRRLPNLVRQWGLHSLAVPMFGSEWWEFRLGLRRIRDRSFNPLRAVRRRVAGWWLGDLRATQALLDAQERELNRKDELLAAREKTLTTQKTVYEAVFDGSPLPALLINESQVVLQANRAARQEFGETAELASIGVEISCLPEPGDWVQEVIELADGGVWLMSLFTPRAAVCTMVSLQNMTDYFQAQGELLNMTEELVSKNREGEALSQSLEQLLVHLEETTAELRALDKMKNNFLSNMRHELNTQLVPVRGYLDLLSRGAVGPVNETQKDLIQRCTEGLERQTVEIDRLLNLSRIAREEEETSLEPGDLYRIIEDAIAMVERIGAGEGAPKIVTDVERPVEALFDRGKMRAVVEAVLSNAVKFSEPDGIVEVIVRPVSEGWKVTVRNTGESIPEGELSRVFSAFYQVDPKSTRKYGGMGIGLNVATMYLQMQNCVYQIESRNGVTEFIFVVPRVGDSQDVVS